MCSYLPTSITDKCETFVHNNIEKIVQLVTI
jgi:hypothetical protein